MLWPVLALGAALLVPLITHGSYARLLEKPWRRGSFLVAGLGIQLALDVLPIPRSRWDDLGFALLVVSYAFLIAFCARNLLMRGMAVVLVGVAVNAFAITINHGMPVKVPADWQRSHRVEATIKHHPREQSDHLLVITDIIVLRSPFDTVLSFGDLILAVGLCDVTYHASRRRRRRSSRARTARASAVVAPLPPPPPTPIEPQTDTDTDTDTSALDALAQLRELEELEELGALDALEAQAQARAVAPSPIPAALTDDDGERVDDDRVVRVHRR
jgi:hypothetical protein